MNKIGVFIILILFVSCQRNKEVTDEKERYIRSLIEYLNNNTVDSLALAQPFFNDKFRSKDNPYNSYIIGLEQLKIYLQDSDVVDIHREESDSDIYVLSKSAVSDSSRIFLLVRNDGIESFSPLFKGKKIVGWM